MTLPYGQRIISGSDDKTIRLWFADIEGLLDLANPLIQRDPPIHYHL
jgi:WD40 repeat protein